MLPRAAPGPGPGACHPRSPLRCPGQSRHRDCRGESSNRGPSPPAALDTKIHGSAARAAMHPLEGLGCTTPAQSLMATWPPTVPRGRCWRHETRVRGGSSKTESPITSDELCSPPYSPLALRDSKDRGARARASTGGTVVCGGWSSGGQCRVGAGQRSEVRTSYVSSALHTWSFFALLSLRPLVPRSSFSTYILYSTHLIYSYAAQRSEVRTSAPTLDCFLPSSLSARPLVPRSSFSSRPDLCFSAGSGLPWRCGSIPPGLTIRFRSTIIHNRVRVVVQGGLPPSHLNLCGGLRSGTERTICNNTRLTDIDTSVTEILDLYARPRARKSSSFMPAISACRRECG